MTPCLLALALAAAPAPRLAVLPFENATGDAQYEPLRAGLADMVLTDLAGAPPLLVVERARLNDILSELKLQQTRAFDPKQRVQTGKLVGATHVVFGTLSAVAPKVRLDVRVVTVPGGETVARANAAGPADDLFDVEAQVVSKLLAALQVALVPPSSGHVSVQGLAAYGRGLDHADAGRLDEAKSALAAVVRDAPGFEPAKVRYAEVLKRLRDAQKQRGSALDEAARTLTERLEPYLGRPPVERAVAARIALANLALLQLSRLIDAKEDEARWVPPGKREAARALEEQFVAHATKLVAELRARRGKPPLSPEEQSEN